MEQRNRNGSVSHCRKEGHSPVGLVPGTDCNLIASLKTTSFEHDVHLLYPSGNVSVMQSHALIVRNRRTVPVFLEGLLKNLVN